MAIYTHICTILAPKRYAIPIYSAFTARKLVHATPRGHSYSAVPPNFPAEGCSANIAIQTHGQTTERSSLQVTKQA